MKTEDVQLDAVALTLCMRNRDFAGASYLIKSYADPVDAGKLIGALGHVSAHLLEMASHYGTESVDRLAAKLVEACREPS